MRAGREGDPELKPLASAFDRCYPQHHHVVMMRRDNAGDSIDVMMLGAASRSEDHDPARDVILDLAAADMHRSIRGHAFLTQFLHVNIHFSN